MPRKPFFASTALSAAALTLGLAGPATAASIGVQDPQDISHGSDLRAVELRHGERKVVVVTSHTNLRRDPRSGSGGVVFLDTDRQDPGPEFVVVGGYFEGTDYALLHTAGLSRRTWGDPVDGSYRMTIDYAKDQVRTRISRNALGNPERVRIAVRVAGTRTDGGSARLVDWLGEPRVFTPWVVAD